MSNRPFHKWTVEIEVSETWVEDGFDLTDGRMHDIMTKHLSFAYSSEIRCKVIGRPPDADVAAAMGYESVKAYVRKRDREQLADELMGHEAMCPCDRCQRMRVL